MTGAATRGPASVPAPPRITMVRKKIELSNSKASGLMKPWKKANRCAAQSGERGADCEGDGLNAAGAEPDCLRRDRVLPDRQEGAPQGECIRLRRMSVVNASMKTISTNCRSSGSRVPNTSGRGMLRTPWVPPVTSDHSTRTLPTMMPRASGHHREVRPLELERRDGDQNARRAREHHQRPAMPTRSRSRALWQQRAAIGPDCMKPA